MKVTVYMFRFRSETLVLDADARAEAPGQFVALPDGVTHYELSGPHEGDVVVLVHGFSVPYYVWDPAFDALTAAGFRALRYDLFGRGYSDRPDAVYGHDLYDRQLLGLLDALELHRPVHLLGLSMGGVIVVGFAGRHPERVRSLCLVDPAGFPFEMPFGLRLLTLPPLGEWILDRFGEKLLVSALADDFQDPPDQERFDDYQRRYRAQMKYRGFRRALLSTLRSGMLSASAAAYARVGEQTGPVMLIWGREDRTIPFEISEQVRAAIPRAEFHPIDGAGHAPHYEKPTQVNPLLIAFLRRA
jgi:pimeloyl-ACP methyl ester carboxylesterase